MLHLRSNSVAHTEAIAGALARLARVGDVFVLAGEMGAGKTAFAKAEEKPNYLGNLTSLKKLVELDGYASPHSDIVALMVLEHEAHMHNFITRLHYESQMALSRYQHIRYLRSMGEGFLKYLLFTEETPLKARVKGPAGFAEHFADLAIRLETESLGNRFDALAHGLECTDEFVVLSCTLQIIEHRQQRAHIGDAQPFAR